MDQLVSAFRRCLIPCAVAVALAALISACGASSPTEVAERPAEELYNEAMNLLQDNKPLQASLKFEEVDRQHPGSVWANKAQLMAAYAHYQFNQYDDAILALDRFIQLHPGSSDAPYAYYLKALSYYERITDVGRDQLMTEQALKALQEVVRRYPESKYARDARLKIDLTYDHLAGKEMEIGRFYLKRGHYLAAINRFRTVVEKFQTTSHVPEALHRLTEAYLALGVTDEAQTAAAVLGHNYPGSEWYMDSYTLMTGSQLRPKENKRSWISRAWNSMF